MFTRIRQSTEATPHSRQSLQTPASCFRQSAETPASRRGTATPGRQSTATPAPGREAAKQLPEYEAPTFSLNPAAQRALAALTQASSLRKLEKELGEAQAAVSNAAAEVNDRFVAKEKKVEEHKKRKRKEEQEGTAAADGSQDESVDKNLEELRDRVDRMTQRMDESMRKLIDGQHGVQHIKDSLASTAEDARAHASTQASTQQVRSQRRQRRASGSGSEEEDEDEQYPDFEPTDPTSGTQAPQSARNAFTAKLETAKTRYQSHSMAARYTENNDYVEFRRVVHDARNQDSDVPLPHASEWFPEGDVPAPGITARPRANANEEDDDDDIAIERTTISTKCPLTLQEFKNPLSSKKCTHSFERDAIMELITASRGPVQCPVPGCQQVLAKTDLHLDQVLLRKIKRIQRAKELEEEEADSDSGAGNSGTQRNATLIEDDDEDGADVDALVERQTQMKAEPRVTGTTVVPASAAPARMQPVELGDTSQEEADEDTSME